MSTRRKGEKPNAAAQLQGATQNRGRSLARVAVQLERLPITRLDRRQQPDDPDQLELKVEFQTGPYYAEWHVTPDGDGVLSGSALPEAVLSLLPSPLARDILVVVGEWVNRQRLATWDIDSATMRTAIFTLPELMASLGIERTGPNYEALAEACLRLGKLRISARHAWKDGGKWVSRSVFGLFDRVDVLGPNESPLGWVVKLQLSLDYAKALVTDSRLLDTETWRVLRTDSARALYRLLEVERHMRDRRGETQLAVPLQFLRDRLPVAGAKAVHAKRVLDRAYQELVDAGYLATRASAERYRDASSEELQRFPARHGSRSKRESVQFTILRAPSPVRKPAVYSDAEKAKLLEVIGVKGEVDTLKKRVQRVVQLTGDRDNYKTFVKPCEALSWDDFDRICNTIAKDRGPSDSARILAATFLARANAALGSRRKSPSSGS